MGKKVVLAPRNSAEAVALGVSACFLAVAGVVVHGNAAVDSTTRTSSTNLAASVEVPRTYSRPSSYATVNGSRVPVLAAEPPLVMLPVNQQLAAKIAAQGTERGDGVILVAFSRGAGTLSTGGGLSGIAAAPPVSPSQLSGAVGFPTSSTATTGSGIITASPPAVTTPPTTEPTSPPTTEPTSPPTTEPTSPPTTEPTSPPTTEPTTPPTTPAEPGDEGSTDPGSTTGSGTGSSTGSTGTTDAEAGTTADSVPTGSQPALAPAPPAAAPTPEDAGA